MKFHYEITIDRPREAVWRTFDSTDNLKQWQPTLKKLEHKSGRPGQVGAISELTYDENGRDHVLTETIVARDEPYGFVGVYANKGVTNTVRNRFEELSGGKTRWIVDADFAFHGLLFRAMSMFMKKPIDNRMKKDLLAFKDLANEID